MKINHQIFACHVRANTYNKSFFEFCDGIYSLSIQWGHNGICVYTDFFSLKSLVSFVRKLDEGRAKRVFVNCLKRMGVNYAE